MPWEVCNENDQFTKKERNATHSLGAEAVEAQLSHNCHSLTRKNDVNRIRLNKRTKNTFVLLEAINTAAVLNVT